jgi:hypothetical protein
LNHIQKNESLTPTSALLHRCLAANPFDKAKPVVDRSGLMLSNITGPSNENDDLSPRKCPNSTMMVPENVRPENALIRASESPAD